MFTLNEDIALTTHYLLYPKFGNAHSKGLCKTAGLKQLALTLARNHTSLRNRLSNAIYPAMRALPGYYGDKASKDSRLDPSPTSKYLHTDYNIGDESQEMVWIKKLLIFLLRVREEKRLAIFEKLKATDPNLKESSISADLVTDRSSLPWLAKPHGYEWSEEKDIQILKIAKLYDYKWYMVCKSSIFKGMGPKILQRRFNKLKN